jgi:hypothetical protein
VKVGAIVMLYNIQKYLDMSNIFRTFAV